MKTTLGFHPLKEIVRWKEVMKRVIAVALFPIAYIALLLTAAWGMLLHPILKKRQGIRVEDLEKGKQSLGEWIEKSMQEVSIGRYHWKASYVKSSLPSMAFYALVAVKATIAYKGILSNYQQVPFQDPVTKQWANSAEHLFQAYKFPDTQRAKVFQCKSPDEALLYAKGHLPDSYQTYWTACSLHLMVFVQLAKALEPKTGFKEYLLETQDDFLIEDTSKRRATSSAEAYWGDNGDGTGKNQLGWAQMKARDFILAYEKTDSFNAEKVVDYFNIHLRSSLEAYSTQVFSTQNTSFYID